MIPEEITLSNPAWKCMAVDGDEFPVASPNEIGAETFDYPFRGMKVIRISTRMTHGGVAREAVALFPVPMELWEEAREAVIGQVELNAPEQFERLAKGKGDGIGK